MSAEFVCPICTESFRIIPNGEIEAREICAAPCGHMFHITCLSDWIVSDPPDSSCCPICRAVIRVRRILRLFPSTDDALGSSRNSARTSVGGGNRKSLWLDVIETTENLAGVNRGLQVDNEALWRENEQLRSGAVEAELEISRLKQALNALENLEVQTVNDLPVETDFRSIPKPQLTPIKKIKRFFSFRRRREEQDSFDDVPEANCTTYPDGLHRSMYASLRRSKYTSMPRPVAGTPPPISLPDREGAGAPLTSSNHLTSQPKPSTSKNIHGIDVLPGYSGALPTNHSGGNVFRGCKCHPRKCEHPSCICILKQLKCCHQCSCNSPDNFCLYNA